MSAEFNVTITDQDMYRFNMYHAYHGFQGIFATVIGLGVLAVACVTAGKVETVYSVLYVLFGVVFLLYVPVSLRFRSRQQIRMSEVLKHPLNYKLDQEGVHVSQNEQTADLKWEQMYKVVFTKNNLLIYSNRVNAYVIPLKVIGGQAEGVRALAKQHLERYRLKLR